MLGRLTYHCLFISVNLEIDLQGMQDFGQFPGGEFGIHHRAGHFYYPSRAHRICHVVGSFFFGLSVLRP